MCIQAIFPAVFVLAALLSCGGEKQQYSITTKTIAIVSESKACKDCAENDIKCCVMRYDGRRFIRNQTYVFDSTGKVYDYTIAPQMGTIIYERSNMPPEYESYYQIKKQQVKWVADKKMLIDNNDTIRKFELLAEQRVIITDGSLYSGGLAAKGNVVIYTYE